MITLGIETSCDETACAVIKNGTVLSSIVSSSVKLHEPYGGVVPEIASRFHLEYIGDVFQKSFKKANVLPCAIDLIAVTNGPGLAGSLLTGISFAKALGYALRLPVIGVNHLEAHLYANFVSKNKKSIPMFPFIGLVVSGGHTSIFLCRNVGNFDFLGNTQDDAVGEAFDKVSKIMGLGYPGGPVIERKSSLFNGQASIIFPKTYLKKESLDFSFSGIKTAVLYYTKKTSFSRKHIPEICHSFQESVFDVIVDKALKACRKYNISTLVAGGGVASNKIFSKKLMHAALDFDVLVHIPEKCYCPDNAAMVGILGEMLYKAGNFPKPDLTETMRVRSRR